MTCPFVRLSVRLLQLIFISFFLFHSIYFSFVVLSYQRICWQNLALTSKIWSLTESHKLRKLYLLHFRVHFCFTIFLCIVVLLFSRYFFLTFVPNLFYSSRCNCLSLCIFFVSMFVYLFACVNVCLFVYVSRFYGQFVIVNVENYFLVRWGRALWAGPSSPPGPGTSWSTPS